MPSQAGGSLIPKMAPALTLLVAAVLFDALWPARSMHSQVQLVVTEG
jgi:hypothetical protein